MKVLVLNGSPRNGNTKAALTAIVQGIEENMQCEVEFLMLQNIKLLLV